MSCSDSLNNVDKSLLDSKLKIVESPLSYVKQERSGSLDILFSVEIPWPTLKLWYNNLGETKETSSLKYVDLLNASINGQVVHLQSSRLEARLREKARHVKALYSKTKGRKYNALNDNVYKICIRKEDCTSFSELQESHKMLHEKIEYLNDEINKWKLNYKNLEEEKEKKALIKRMWLQLHKIEKKGQ